MRYPQPLNVKAVSLTFSVVVCLCLSWAPLPAYSQGDCYFQENSTDLVLGNSKVKLRFDKYYGRVLAFTNVDTGTDFIRDDYNPSSFLLRYHNNPSKWQVSHRRPATRLVKGWEQPLTAWRTEVESDSIKLEFDSTFALGGGTCTVTRWVKVFDGSPFTRWRIIVDNPTNTGRTVISATYPHLRGINVLGGDDYFISPTRRGERWEDFYFPRELPGTTVHIRGPTYPEASWQWMWYGNPREGLYYSVLDPNAFPKEFRFGYDDRDLGGQYPQDNEMAITHFAFREPGGVWASSIVEIGVQSGPGWYWGADRYREWMEKDPPEGPGWRREYPDWAKEAHSFCWGTVTHFTEYPVEFLANWHPRGNYNMMDMDSGDRDNPAYYWPRGVMKESKGGYSAMVEGMQGSHSQGDRVLFFANVNLANEEGNWYAQNPNETVITAEGTKKARIFSYDNRTFYEQCYFSTALQDTAVADHTTLKNAGLDGVWLDCVFVFSELFCYDPSHGHSSPLQMGAPGATAMMQRLNDEVWRKQGEGIDRIVAIEAINDFLIPYVDYWALYHLGGYQGDYAGERDYPEVARYLIPGLFGMLRQGDDLAAQPWPEASFAFGCKMGGPKHADHWEYYNALDAVSGAFYHGTFKADLGLTKSRSDFKAFSFVGISGGAVAVTLWNRGSSQQSIDISLDLAALGITGSVAGANDLMGRQLDWSGGASFTSTVPAGGVTAVKLSLSLYPTPTPTLTWTPTHTPPPTNPPTQPPTVTPTPTPTITNTPPPTHTPTVTLTPTPSPNEPRRVAVMKREGVSDNNLYYYSCPAVGDLKFQEVQRRNPSPIARDLWIIPAGNDAVGMAAIELTGDVVDELIVLKKEVGSDANLYLYNSLVMGDWDYWDALSRNPSPMARDLWVIPAGNDAVGVTAIDVDGGREEVAILRKESTGDINLYLYNSPLPGDWTFWDAISRNPSPLARDLWVMPVGNDAVGVASLDVTGDGWKELAILKKEGESDINLYLYNAPRPGDWTYWDAVSRNPSPLAKDLWIISGGNDAIGVASVDMDLAPFAELAILKMESQNDMNLYLYNSPLPGDWTYWDAVARNPVPRARDLWSIPSGNNASGLAAVRVR